MNVSIEEIELTKDRCVTRIPFRFGAVTLREAVTCTARIRVATDHGSHEGYASSLCVPKWFEKDPSKSADEDVHNLLESAELARRTFLQQDAGLTKAASGGGGSTAEASAFQHWHRAWQARVEVVDTDSPDRLVRGFGVALCEAALIDATCQAAGVSFFDALRADTLGFRPGTLRPELSGWDLARALPDKPRQQIALRHTVGMADTLRGASRQERLDDGLPEALDEDIRRYGLHWFKLKIGAGPEADFQRLVEIAEVLREDVGDQARLTLDGNEQYESLDGIAELMRRLQDDERGRYLLAALAYLEQPLARTHTFDRRFLGAMDAVREFCPVIIDEADNGLDAFPRAHALGYRGISAKNCKGVFRSLMNFGLCEVLGDGSFQSAEDLTNLGVLAVQQDLAVVTALGLEHVERNGHHYFRGLDHLPLEMRQRALDEHPDLYEPLGRDSVALTAKGGLIECGSVHRLGFGHSVGGGSTRQGTAGNS